MINPSTSFWTWVHHGRPFLFDRETIRPSPCASLHLHRPRDLQRGALRVERGLGVHLQQPNASRVVDEQVEGHQTVTSPATGSHERMSRRWKIARTHPTGCPLDVVEQYGPNYVSRPKRWRTTKPGAVYLQRSCEKKETWLCWTR